MSNGTGVTEDGLAKETLGHEVEKNSTAPIPQASDQQSLAKVLPTAIEIIEESSSQTSGTQETEGGVSPDTLTEMDPKAQGLQSPDYSPSLLKLLGSDPSSSEESMQAYLSRKLDTRTEEVDEPGPSGRQTKCSINDPIPLNPSLNLALETDGPKSSEPVVIFLAPLSESEQQIGTDGPRGSAKRPRIGSSVTVDTQPPPKFGLLSSYLISPNLLVLILNQEELDDPFRPTKTISSSEVEFETDI